MVMIQLDYQLKEKEIIHYYQFVASNSKKTTNEKILVASWLPMTAFMIGLYFHLNTIYWIIAILISIIYVFLFAPMVFDNITSTVTKRKLKQESLTTPEIHVTVDENTFIYNGKEMIVTGYGAYLDLFIIFFSDKSNLIVPESAFGSDKKAMERFVRTIMLKVGK